MNDKTVNYTEEMTNELVGAYTQAASNDERNEVVTEMAEKFGKTVASIRAKLVREKVYVKAEATKGRGVLKDELVAAIATLTNSDEELMDSLAKATKEALTIVYGRLNALAVKAGEESVSL